MATLPDLSSFDHWQSETAGATLTLPIRGKQYTWRSGDLSMWSVLTLQRLEQKVRDLAARAARGEEVDTEEVALTAAEQRRLDHDLLGDQLQVMTDDGVKQGEVSHVVATLLTWHLRGEDAATRKWTAKEEKADPPAPAASTKTAGSSTTRTKKARVRSGGRSSSPTGASSKRTSTASTKSTSPTKTSAARGRRAGS